jgi:hypothetical protein
MWLAEGFEGAAVQLLAGAGVLVFVVRAGCDRALWMPRVQLIGMEGL